MDSDIWVLCWPVPTPDNHISKEIFAQAQPSSVTVLKMEVPCCNGISQAALWALEQSGRELAAQVHTIGIRGGIDEQKVAQRHAAG